MVVDDWCHLSFFARKLPCSLHLDTSANLFFPRSLVLQSCIVEHIFHHIQLGYVPADDEALQTVTQRLNSFCHRLSKGLPALLAAGGGIFTRTSVLLFFTRAFNVTGNLLQGGAFSSWLWRGLFG